MTYEEVAAMIAEIGFVNAYYQFPEGTDTEPPFICFYYPNSDDFYADNINYKHVTELNIELYTNEKDFTAEAAVESVLTAHCLSWAKSESYIDSEKLYENLYTLEVVING